MALNPDQFHITHSEEEGSDEIAGRYTATHIPTASKAQLTYTRFPSNKGLLIDNMSSETQQQGHMSHLLDQVYSKFNDHYINFGEVTAKGYKTAIKMGKRYGRTGVDHPETGETEEF